MTKRRTPFGLTAREAADFAVLVDGVPYWLRPSLVDWVVDVMTEEDAWNGTKIVPHSSIHTLNRELRLGVRAGDPFTGLSFASNRDLVRNDMEALGDTLLRVVDWLLPLFPKASPEPERLNRMLTEATSKWQVGVREGAGGLVARVPEGVQDAAESLIAKGGTAGKLLADAWQKVHRLEPDDSGAYAAAVKAVEVASFEALGIDNSNGKATLSHSIRAIEHDPTWRLPFEREPKNHPTNSTLASMMRTLFGGHRDRHGSDAYSGVSHAEAEAAVNLAVTLVGWLTSGAVRQDWPEAEKY